MPNISLFALCALALGLSAWSASAATNQGSAGGLNQKPALPTVSPHNPDPRMASPNMNGSTESAPVEAAPARQNSAGNVETELQRSTMTEITFNTGGTTLTAPARQRLNQLMRDGQRRGQIESVKVLSWGDISYPAASQPAPSAQVDLAKKRAETIANHLGTRNANVKVETYNMAERPSALQDLLGQSEANLKNTIAEAGLAGEGRASRAMVMVVVR